MTEIIKETVLTKIKLWETNYANTGKPFNLTTEIAHIFSSIFLTCTYGRDVGQDPVEIIE